MLKTRTILTMLAILAAGVIHAAEGPQATVDAAKKTGTIEAGGAAYRLYANSKGLNLKVGDCARPVRFSAAEKGGGQDWLGVKVDSVKLTKDAANEKEIVMTGALVFRTEEPNAKTSRGQAAAKGKPAPVLDATVRGVLSAKAGTPGVAFTYEIVNNGEPMTFYMLPWLNGGSGYVVPGATGPMRKQYAGKYATVSKKGLPWIYLEGSAEVPGMGVGFLEPDKVFVGEHSTKAGAGGSIYLNYQPRYPKLGKGESAKMALRFLPTTDVAEVQKLAK